MKIAIFSDLHLELSDDSPRNQKFLSILDELRTQKIDELWLLGDIYDLFIGPQRFWRKVHSRLFEALEKLTLQGCHVLWIEGNHDFYIEKHLESMGVEVVKEDSLRRVDSKKVFLSHGDKVNTEDLAYLKWRKTTKSKSFRFLISCVPNIVGEKLFLPIAQRASKKSRAHHHTEAQPQIDKMYENFAETLIKEKELSGVFLGHHHKECLKEFGEGFYLNLGGWSDERQSYALWETQSKVPKIIK